MSMVYAGGHVSGAHYNPAISVAAVMAGALPRAQVVPDVVSQVAGATVAAVLVEILFTFALGYVVLNVAVSKKTQGNSYYGLAIGMTVTAAAFAGGGISGGAFNPAVGIGPTIIHATMGSGGWTHLWIYLAGPISGAALAAVVYGMQAKAD